MENIPRTPKKKLIITDQISFLEKKLTLITDEALNIEHNILFNGDLLGIKKRYKKLFFLW